MPKKSPSRFTMVPLRKSSEPTATRRARIIMGVGLVAAITGPLSLGFTLLNSNTTVDFSQVDPQGRGVADAAAFEVLAGEDLKIPTSRSFDPQSTNPPRDVRGQDAVQLPYEIDSLTWTGFERNTFLGENMETNFEVHTYLMVPDMDDYLERYVEATGYTPSDDEAAPEDAETEEEVEGGNTSNEEESTEESEGEESGGSTEEEEVDEDELTEQEEILEYGITPYQLEVPVLLTSDGPRLAGAPSIAPWTDAEAEPAGQSDYSDHNRVRVEANNQTARQIGRWAVAYASNDEETLLDITGDTDSNNRYVGLGGWQVPDTNRSVQILQAISVNEGDQLLRVRVLLEDARVEAGENENPYRMYADFDVLVTEPETATPNVVAWGAAGSGAKLSPYVNALER